jgi:8-oxo-dGTP pyrophosphatase MutT (NUDIX family)
MGDEMIRATAGGVRRVVLCFVVREVDGRHEVLLGRKKRGFGLGKVVGLGGHLLPGETERVAAAREVAEESGVIVDPSDLAAAGGVLFTFPSRPDWDMHTTVFVATHWGGTPVETEEIAPRSMRCRSIGCGATPPPGFPRYWQATPSAALSCTGLTTR